MGFDVVDAVWSAMKDAEYYSPNDLANSLEQPVESVTRVLKFLEKYEFAEQITKSEMIFRKLNSELNPAEILGALYSVLGNPVPDNSMPDNEMP
jgi:hypothetical protein